MSTLAIPIAFQTRLARAELVKGLRLMWRRRAMVVVAMISYGLTYLGISFFIGGGHLVKDLMVRTLPALMAVVIASVATVEGVGGISEEINGGTLEQTRLSPASPQLQILGRMAALALEGLGVAAVLGTIFVFGVGLDINPHLPVLIPVPLTVLDALGYGLIMTALVVRVPSIGAISHVGNMVVMAFGGMLVPIAFFPQGLQVFARFIPTTLGVQSIDAILAGHGLSATWSDGTLPWLLVHTAVVLGAGFSLYAINIRRAQREGGLSPR